MHHSTRVPLSAALLSLLLFSGCTDSTGVLSNQSVRADASPGSIRVENMRAESIYSVVMGRERAALANWAACVESVCGEIPAGQHIIIPDPNTGLQPGAAREREAIIYWWVAVRNGEGDRVAGPIQHVIVQLR